MHNISTIIQQSKIIISDFYPLLLILIPAYLGYNIFTNKVSCKSIASVLHIQGNSYIIVETHEISKPLFAVFSESIILPDTIRNLDVLSKNENILKIKKNIIIPRIRRLKRNSKVKIKIRYEWFPEKDDLYLISHDLQVHPNMILKNFKVANVCEYDLHFLELFVELPLNAGIKPDNFNPKSLQIIDTSNDNKIQKRSTKTSLINDKLIHTLKVGWEADIPANETKIFQICYNL